MTLQNRIDFVAFLSVKNANPNGDPLSGNMPRVDRTGRGEISAECIKRKLRNRLQGVGHKISVVSNDKATDNYTSIQGRVEGTVGKPGQDQKAYAAQICSEFIDVRAFGGTFAWKGARKGEGVSLSILGPVSIGVAKTVDPVIVESMQITKSTNGTDSEKRGSDTMGMRHFVEFGLYRVQGSISVQAAQRTGFSVEDAEALKEALRTLFDDDESSARPAGTMEVVKLYWFEHDCNGGRVTTAQVFRSVHVGLKDPDKQADDVDDYVITVDVIPGVVMTEVV